MTLPEFLGQVLSALSLHREVIEELVQTGGRVEFWISLYVTKPDGIELDADLVQRCAELHMGVCILASLSPKRKETVEPVNIVSNGSPA